MDPVNVVARNQLLVLWSRLGGFDRADLDTLLWRERWLFEYWAHSASIVLTEDYPIHHLMMRDYRVTVESAAKRAWLAANDDFRRYVLDLLADSGPVPGEAIEDRAVDNLICDRDRTERLWGFAYRNEMYVQKDKRQYGYYVMPVLAGERLAGRVAVRVDRKVGVLTVEGMYAEPGAPADPALPRGAYVAGVVRGRRVGQLRRTDGVRRILSMGESAGRSRRAQAR
jgi:uncharacterized protein YcaQ